MPGTHNFGRGPSKELGASCKDCWSGRKQYLCVCVFRCLWTISNKWMDGQCRSARTIGDTMLKQSLVAMAGCDRH